MRRGAGSLVVVPQGRAAAARHRPRPSRRRASSPTPSAPPPDFMVKGGHDADKLVAGLVGKKQHAERQVQAGVDIIVAQGYEAGGHTGEVATMVLVPEVVDAVGDTPVLAAGGIATGRQIAASMALGAQGVWCGSVWLTTEEAETHPVVKEKFLAATSSDTVRSRASHRQAGPPAALGVDRRVGRPRQPRPAAHAAARHAHRRGPGPHRPAPPRANPGAKDLVNYFVGQAVGQMNQVSRPPRWSRHGRRVRRSGRAGEQKITRS